MRIASYIELGPHAKPGCTEAGNPLPRIWINIEGRSNFEFTMPSNDQLATEFLSSLIEVCGRLRDQIANDLKP